MAFKRKWINPSGTRTYYAWRSMRARCSNPKNASFAHYGGRGIQVCPEWSSFDQFVADMGEVPNGLTLDRIDNDGNYEPMNCRWVSIKEQLNNQRRNRRIEFNGEVKTLAQWAEHLGVRHDTLSRRLSRMAIDKALRPGLIRPVAQHGSRQKYDTGCRCDQCRETHNARMRRARARRKEKHEAGRG